LKVGGVDVFSRASSPEAYWNILASFKRELDNYPFSVGYDLEARKFKGFSMIIEQYNLSVHGGEETKGKR